METTRKKILLVEDDPNLGSILQEYLNAKGFKTNLSRNGKEGYDAFLKEDYDVLLLDVMMPVKDGFTLAREIREIDTQTPVIFLTAKSMKEDTLEGFRLGGDDYITKPFSMEELLLRIQAILKRTGQPNDDASLQEFDLGKFHFNYDQQLLQIGDKETKLTSKESDLLKLLCAHKNQVLERNYALQRIWKDDNYFNSRSMDVYIAKLRKHLKEDPAVEILNIHGRGFKLLVNPD
ncbi:MAG: response regulator transcription factor [Flavobacteriales bacterium]|nr:response regulator transcription factor [Flavobacteriales bacterium]MCB9449669.1 response regulator transcription factor [Flavobacteriales bacterium]